MLLAGDIGGTKTDLAIFSPGSGPRAPLAQAEYPSGDYPSLEAIVGEFLAGCKLPIDSACFDVAGPVVGRRSKITNLPWLVDCAVLERALKLPSVSLLNDLEAIARAVPLLTEGDLYTLNKGVAQERGPIAVVAPGTGLGEAYLTWEGDGYEAHPSEGGHADFAPSTPTELGVLGYLQPRYGHVSIERVCSGDGLPNIYDYLRDSGFAPETPSIAAQLATAKDRTPIIAQGGLAAAYPCPLCAATLNTFISILACEAGNMALKVLSTGGVYLAGGMPRRLKPLLEGGGFMEAFGRKGRLNSVLAQMPVHVITYDKVALVGAASYGLQYARDAIE